MKIQMVLCNRAYGKTWYKNIRRTNQKHFLILDEILNQIQLSDGGDISLQKIKENREVAQVLDELSLNPIPSRGQMFSHNGNGIRHAKYSKSKNIAIIWERIGNVIFVTFDDHAPIRYHRAIYFLRELRLGRTPTARKSRDRRWFIQKLYRFWGDRGKYRMKGINPRDRYYE